MAILQDLIVAVRNLRAELKVEQNRECQSSFSLRKPKSDLCLRKNRGAIERLANVEGVTFVESSLSKLSGARHTARLTCTLSTKGKLTSWPNGSA